MTRNYGGIIWTNHALQRLRERGIRQEDAWLAFTKSDQSRYAKSRSAWVYYKTFNSRTIEVVAKQNERKEWVILSVWSKNGTKRFKKSTSFVSILFLIGLLILLLVIVVLLSN